MGYYRELGKIIAQGRGGQENIPKSLKEILKPSQVGSTIAPRNSLVTVGYCFNRPASFVVAGIERGGNKTSRKMIKVVPVLGKHQIYSFYDSFPHIQHALFREATLLREANPYMPVYVAQIVPSQDQPQDVIALGTPLQSVDEIDPRYPVGIVMPEYDIGETSSLRDKLEAGEIHVLRRLQVGQALADFHMRRADQLSREHAFDIASFEPLKNKITVNADYFKESLKIRQDIEGNVDFIDGVWQVDRHTTQFNRVYHGVFNVHWKQFARILQKRIDNGYVRGIHGDMKSEHFVYNAKGVPYGARILDYWHLLDRAAFNNTFGFGDILGDLAHLTVDMESFVSEQYRSIIPQVQNSYLKASEQEMDIETKLLLYVFRWDKANVRYCSKVKFKGETEGTKNYLEVEIHNMEKLDKLIKDL